MNFLIDALTELGILRDDLDYHLRRSRNGPKEWRERSADSWWLGSINTI